MEIYLLKFSACLLVFWLVYVLLLERQNMHRSKRFYLLGALALALVIPTLTIIEYVEPIVTTFETAPVFFPMELTLDEAVIEELTFFNLKNTLWLFYGLGVLLFFIRFVINLIKMKQRISTNENINKRSFVYVLLQENLIPHSFFRYIFFNKTKYESNNIPKEVMLHEETHAKQLHSLDIIIIELLQIVFWFHPLIYILKHHIKLNHEFLADQAVLEQGSDTKTYQNILLQFSSNTQEYQLASAINYSSIKKRFTVMKTQTSKTRIWLSTLLVLPIIAILFYSFAEKEYVEKETLKTSEVLTSQNTNTITVLINRNNKFLINDDLGSYESLEKLLKQLPKSGYTVNFKTDTETSPKLTTKVIELFKTSHFFISSNNKELNAIAWVLNQEGKQQKPPTEKEIFAYNAWAKKIHAESKVLSDDATFYPPINEQDLIKFSAIHKRMSPQQKNQSIEFPFSGLDVKDSEHSFPLVPKTKQQIATKKQIAEYNTWAKKINTAVAKAEANKNVNTYPIIKKKEVEKYKRIYSSMTTEQKKNAQPFPQFPQLPPPPPPPPAPRVKKGEVSNIPPPPPPAIQEKATAKQIAAYNVWAKKLNSQDMGDRIIRKKDHDKYKNIYGLMTAEQKKNAEPFPQLPPPPPPPPAPKVKKGEASNIPPPPPPTKALQLKNGQKKTLNEIIKETPKSVKSGYEMLDNGESHYYTVHKGEKTYYNKDGYITDKNGNILPPPPPVIETTLDFVIRMAKSNAKFFNEGKSISSDKAIDLIKKNDKLNVNAKGTDDESLVYITEKPIIINGKVGKKGKN